jgi:hypothetical protein
MWNKEFLVANSKLAAAQSFEFFHDNNQILFGKFFWYEKRSTWDGSAFVLADWKGLDFADGSVDDIFTYLDECVLATIVVDHLRPVVDLLFAGLCVLLEAEWKKMYVKKGGKERSVS